MNYEFNPSGPVTPYGLGGQPLMREDPGKGFGIAGFICSFFVPLLGLIFALISRSKSRAAGLQPSGLATAALVLSIIFMVLGYFTTRLFLRSIGLE